GDGDDAARLRRRHGPGLPPRGAGRAGRGVVGDDLRGGGLRGGGVGAAGRAVGRGGRPSCVLGVSWRSWQAVTAMRRPGREVVSGKGHGSGGGRTYVEVRRERRHASARPDTKTPGG